MGQEHRYLQRRQALATALAVAGTTLIRPAFGQAGQEEDPWPALAAQIFNDRTIDDGSTLLSIEVPYRAEDAAVVPITIRNLLPAGDSRHLRAITLVIDQNPSPLAAIFAPRNDSGIHFLSTRVRVDSYTKLHAVAEMQDGNLFVSQRFIKAAGGCSAPATKQTADSVSPGAMRFRMFPPDPDSDLAQAQLMIRHPNYSGMQMDQVSRLYVPAWFISSVRLWQGDDLLLSIESGISISENPEFRFDYRPNGAPTFTAEARDSKGQTFTQKWPATRA